MIALVTGSSGLIGRHVAERLRSAGYTIIQVDNSGGPRSDARIYFRTAPRVDVVVHCAAVVGGRRLIDSGQLAHAANLEIDAAFAQWVERVRPRRAVYVSSCAAYPVCLQQEGGRPLRESDIDLTQPELPDELYGWAKLTGELLVQRLLDQGLHVTVVRPFGVYGSGQAGAHPIIDFTRQIARRADPLIVWGDGTQVRDFVHVTDVAEAIWALIDQEVNGPVNICTGEPATLTQAAELCAEAAGYSPEIRGLPELPTGLPYRVGCPDLLHRYYKPVISLERGITDLVGGA